MQSVYAKKTGMIILGGGVVKHHICNSNLMVCLWWAYLSLSRLHTLPNCCGSAFLGGRKWCVHIWRALATGMRLRK